MTWWKTWLDRDYIPESKKINHVISWLDLIEIIYTSLKNLIMWYLDLTWLDLMKKRTLIFFFLDGLKFLWRTSMYYCLVISLDLLSFFCFFLLLWACMHDLVIFYLMTLLFIYKQRLNEILMYTITNANKLINYHIMK